MKLTLCLKGKKKNKGMGLEKQNEKRKTGKGQKILFYA